MHSTFRKMQKFYWVMSFKIRTFYSKGLLIHQYEGMPDKFITWNQKKNRERDARWHNNFNRNYAGAVWNCLKLSLTLDDAQPFVREFFYQLDAQPMFVLYLDQTLNVCSNHSPVSASPLAFNTTFNIGKYNFTQSTYKNLNLLKKGTNTYPWFPGPVLVHRKERQEYFSLLGVIRFKKKNRFEKINCHRMWWMSRNVWWHFLTGRQYVSISGTRKNDSFTIHQKNLQLLAI